jgi:hypothetical protein
LLHFQMEKIKSTERPASINYLREHNAISST